MTPLRVAFLTTTLDFGGAETVLFQLLRGLDRVRIAPTVICLMDQGRLGAAIAAMGIPVHTVGLRQGRPSVEAMARLVKLTIAARPDVIQGWMYHGNVAAQIVRLFKSIPIFWCIHNTFQSFAHEKPLTRMMIRLLAAVSDSPRRIVYVSAASRQQHERLGFSGAHGLVIPNGVDTAVFAPCDEARVSVRQEIGIEPGTPLIGLMARFHPQKDHANFFKAASLLMAARSDAHFVLAGTHIDAGNESLRRMIAQHSLQSQVHLLGERTDMPRLNAALDIATSSSLYGESLSIALLEAMACGVPCVTTDVGDNGIAVGSTGIVVPPGDAAALAEGWKQLLAAVPLRRRFGDAARRRVEQEYSIGRCVERYDALYKSAR